jgi:ribulose-bisphosphate carboxylase small chain
MKITQGTFSFLPELSDEEIDAQIKYCLRNGWAMSVEYTDDPHPRNAYWEMWGLPTFDTKEEDSENVLREVRAAREAFPEHYIKVIAYDPTRGRQTSALAFIVNRPSVEKRFILDRQQGPGRTNRFRYVPDESTPATNGAAAASTNGSADGQVADGG